MRKILWLLAALTLTCLSGCLAEQPELPLVTVGVVQSGSMPHRLFLNGQLQARKIATLNSTRPGIVERVGPSEGDHVLAGQPLLWLHPGTLPAEVEQKAAAVSAAQAKVDGLKTQVGYSGVKNLGEVAQAKQSLIQAQIAIEQSQTELQNAQKDMARKRELVKEKSIALVEYEKAELTWKEKGDALKSSRSKAVSAQEALRLSQEGKANTQVQRTDLESAQASLLQARSELASTRSELAHTILRSPISGVVVECKVQAGQLLGGGGESLLTVVDNSALDLFVTVDQADGGRMTPHTPAEMLTDLVPDKAFPVRLVELIPQSDPKTNTVKARFSIGEHHPRLLHGTKVRIHVTLSEDRGLLIPHDALQFDQTHTYVVMVHPNMQLDTRAVTVLDSSETSYLVRAGENLQAGDKVVTAGAKQVNGTQVRIR